MINGGNCSEQICIEADSINEFLLKNNSLIINAPWNKIYKKEVIGNLNFKSQYSVEEDYNFNLRIFKNVCRIVSIPMTGYRYYWWGNGNATSKYHACREEVRRENDKLLYELFLSCGISEEQAKNRILCSKYIETYFLVINLYKRGCPFGFWQKRRKIKQLLFGDKEMKEAYRLYPWSRQSIYVQFMTVGYILHSPLLITTLYSILFFIKNKILR